MSYTLFLCIKNVYNIKVNDHQTQYQVYIYAGITEEKQMPDHTRVVCLPISTQYREFQDSLLKNYSLSPTKLKSSVIIPAKYQNYEPHTPISIDEYHELYGEVVVMTIRKDPILLENAADASTAAAEILRLKCEVENMTNN